ncbi:hypothetical protein N9933_03610 [bacterium]|nr:hypothetical protein [bacterium]
MKRLLILLTLCVTLISVGCKEDGPSQPISFLLETVNEAGNKLPVDLSITITSSDNTTIFTTSRKSVTRFYYDLPSNAKTIRYSVLSKVPNQKYFHNYTIEKKNGKINTYTNMCHPNITCSKTVKL